MEQNLITELSIPGTKRVYYGSGIGNDLLLIDDFADFPLPTEPRRAKCIIVGLCLQGTATYSVYTEEFAVKENDILMIHEGQVLENSKISSDFKGLGFMLSYDFFHEIIKGIHELSSLFVFSRSHPVFSLTAKEAVAMTEAFNQLKHRVDDQDHHFRSDAVRSHMATMVYDLSNAIYRFQQNNPEKLTRAEVIFKSFIKLVEENFRTERRVSWYGEQMCITPKYLSETVKLVSHRTPNEWIDHYVTLEIRVMLKNSAMSIKEIGQCLNFPNQSFLGKYFKEHVGMSPSRYRKS
ncbi:MAG: helix-turn-helix domain-containing protein [Prevotellaceae bacterium]|nr:helix-turn-helix domain-containing protein [Prevotella sp.]MDD7257989.1 helix-turn-helix domain-containing protein [Prevotellaceae bacterium]MDY6131711.1 helix-turn-helix domain-containing protein [Prevotella sp.]